MLLEEKASEEAVTTIGPTRVEVDLGAIRRNYRQIRERVAPAGVMPVVKANAYGHGMEEVALCLERDEGASIFGVAQPEEGHRLRAAGVEAEILVFGAFVREQIRGMIEADLIITASSTPKLEWIEAEARAAGRPARVDLQVDTGMERIGVHHYNADEFLERSLVSPHVVVTGVSSHFASSDAADLAVGEIQLERFRSVLEFYARRGLPAPRRHMANSGAILQLPGSHFDLVRPGVLLYGVYPSREVRRSITVEPAMRFSSRVVYFKVIPAGTEVSYGGTWKSEAMCRIVTVPVGYGDGYSRALSNRAEVLIGGRRYRVVGQVCMDQLLVNLEWGTAYNGDEVVLLGSQGEDEITAWELAEWQGTIPYEVMTAISSRVPRVYRNEEA